MTFWRDNQTAVAACILALLCEDGTRIYLPSRAMQERLNLESEPFDQALQQLLSSGALEGCEWPDEGIALPHYRITGIGRSLLQGYREQWRRDREELDQLLLSSGFSTSVK